MSEICTACREPITWEYHKWSRSPSSGEWAHEGARDHKAQGPTYCGPAGMSALRCKAIDLCDCFDFPEVEKALAAMSDQEVSALADLAMDDS